MAPRSKRSTTAKQPTRSGKPEKKRQRYPILKKYIPIVKGLSCERHSFEDIAAFFGTTPEVIAYIVHGPDFADIGALRSPKLPVLKYADIAYVAKRLDVAIELLDNDDISAARTAILRAAEVVNSPCFQ